MQPARDSPAKPGSCMIDISCDAKSRIHAPFTACRPSSAEHASDPPRKCHLCLSNNCPQARFFIPSCATGRRAIAALGTNGGKGQPGASRRRKTPSSAFPLTKPALTGAKAKAHLPARLDRGAPRLRDGLAAPYGYRRLASVPGAGDVLCRPPPGAAVASPGPGRPGTCPETQSRAVAAAGRLTGRPAAPAEGQGHGLRRSTDAASSSPRAQLMPRRTATRAPASADLVTYRIRVIRTAGQAPGSCGAMRTASINGLSTPATTTAAVIDAHAVSQLTGRCCPAAVRGLGEGTGPGGAAAAMAGGPGTNGRAGTGAPPGPALGRIPAAAIPRRYGFCPGDPAGAGAHDEHDDGPWPDQ